jgi:DNA-binding response OmpR family regulator
LIAPGDRRRVAIVPDPAGPRSLLRTCVKAGPARVAWLILAVEGPVLELGDRVESIVVRTVTDPRRFCDLLAERPRIVVCAQPPADRVTLELVAADRRRRASMRAVHLAPPEAVTERLAALELGFDDALPATTPTAELMGRLIWLDAKARARGGQSPVLLVGDGLELDLAAHQLRRQGEMVHLRPKEFGLLALLAAHPGRAYTRRELLDRVWGPGHDAGTRTVDVHVRWLRAKVEPDPERPVHLITVRGVGYRLDPPQR